MSEEIDDNVTEDEDFEMIECPNSEGMEGYRQCKSELDRTIKEKIGLKLQLEWFKEWHGLLTNPLLTRERREMGDPFPRISVDIDHWEREELQLFETGFKNIWQYLQSQYLLTNQIDQLYNELLKPGRSQVSSDHDDSQSSSGQDKDYTGKMTVAMNQLCDIQQFFSQIVQCQSILIKQVDKLYSACLEDKKANASPRGIDKMALASPWRKKSQGSSTLNTDYAAEMEMAVNYLYDTEQHVTQMMEKVTELTHQQKQTVNELSRVRREKEDALTRLSQIAGTKLKHDNSDITDLSDKNRPTNLAEKFNELYDNEWTDAFDHLTTKEKRVPETAIRDLLYVLENVYTECSKCASSLSKTLYNAVRLTQLTDNTESNKSCPDGPQQNLYLNIRRQITDLMKSTAEFTILVLTKTVKETLQGRGGCIDVHEEHCAPFVDKCIELCWYMNIQEKPVVLLFGFEKGGRFCTDLYRHYTKSGTFNDFLVWPAMHLYKGGPLLQKGVMQPT